MPVSTVEGHEGKFIIGRLGDKNVICMKGRLHHYEGYHTQQVTAPVRLMGLLGVQYLVVTNAAGGINKNFKAGEFHTNVSVTNLYGCTAEPVSSYTRWELIICRIMQYNLH